MEIEQTTTGLIIHEPSDMVKRKVLQYFSLTNPLREFFIYTGNDPRDKKTIFSKPTDTIYISSGFANINDPVIRLLPKPKLIHPPVPSKIEIQMNREPRSRLQEDCIRMMTDESQSISKITVELKPGTGKEQPYSAMIPTPTKNGFTRMGDLNVGDYVFGKNGYPTKITDIFEQGMKDVYELTFEDGRKTRCGLEHLWTISKSKRNINFETVTLEELINIIDVNDVYMPLCDNVQYNIDDHVSCKMFLDLVADLREPQEFMDILKENPYQQPIIANMIIHRIEQGYSRAYIKKDDLNVFKQTLYALGFLVECREDEDDEYEVKWWRPQSNLIQLTSIRKLPYQELSRCIMVDNTDHLYLTDNYIVTHNTFIATYAISKLGLKALIVAPTTLLKNQWVENFVDTGIDKRDIAIDIYDAPNKKLCVVTISAIENALRDNWDGLLQVVNDSGFGIKVIDEAHLHLKGMLKFDSICNIRYNWYMSATLGRSDAQEDNILNRALSDATRFIGNNEYEEYQHSYVHILFQDIYYYPTNNLCTEYFRYGTKGLVRATYYTMLMNYKHGVPFINNIITMMKRAKQIITYEGKILVLIPLISIIQRVLQEMDLDPWFKQFSYAGIDGSLNIPTRRQAMESDFILSTSLSMGTGVDVSNLAAVVNFDQYSSPIINEQIFGRLRDRGKETWYIDVCDHVKQAKSIENWGRKRRNLLPYFPGAFEEIKMLPPIRS